MRMPFETEVLNYLHDLVIQDLECLEHILEMDNPPEDEIPEIKQRLIWGQDALSDIAFECEQRDKLETKEY